MAVFGYSNNSGIINSTKFIKNVNDAERFELDLY